MFVSNTNVTSAVYLRFVVIQPLVQFPALLRDYKFCGSA